jgi:hypothetical protein
MMTIGTRPAIHAPAAMPTATSSRTAGTYGSRGWVSSAAMASPTSEQGTPVKKSKPSDSATATKSFPLMAPIS